MGRGRGGREKGKEEREVYMRSITRSSLFRSCETQDYHLNVFLKNIGLQFDYFSFIFVHSFCRLGCIDVNVMF